MGYDIYLTVFTGKEDKIIVEVGSYTSNVTEMWTEALDEPLKNLDGIVAKEAISLLKKAIFRMVSNPDHYISMNPKKYENGNYDGALRTLEKLLKSCEENPVCKILISC